MGSSQTIKAEGEEAIAEVSAAIKPSSLGYRIVKRGFDILAASCALLVLAPFMLLISLMIRMDSKGPAIFVHARVGKNGRSLALYKFRSMYVNAEAMIAAFTPAQKAEWEQNFKLDHDPRITRVGRILRKTSLDELPQLFNILRGELSMVGPRPVVAEELKKYGKNKDKFLSVTPGLTGYWQAYARSDCSYEKRMEMELHYVENANLLWDIKILFATVGAVLRGRGAK